MLTDIDGPQLAQSDWTNCQHARLWRRGCVIREGHAKQRVRCVMCGKSWYEDSRDLTHRYLNPEVAFENKVRIGKLLAAGKTTRAVSRALGVSLSTVWMVSRVMRRSGLG